MGNVVRATVAPWNCVFFFFLSRNEISDSESEDFSKYSATSEKVLLVVTSIPSIESECRKRLIYGGANWGLEYQFSGANWGLEYQLIEANLGYSWNTSR